MMLSPPLMVKLPPAALWAAMPMTRRPAATVMVPEAAAW
jgi:hypothetical protein